jgi:hypothetical protein
MSKKTVDERLADRLARIGDEAEAGEQDQTARPIPENVKVTRGNARRKVLQVRLNPDEYAAIERIAERRGLPASTVAREALLTLIADEDPQDPLVTLIALADRIKAAAVDAAAPRDFRILYDTGGNPVSVLYGGDDEDERQRTFFRELVRRYGALPTELLEAFAREAIESRAYSIGETPPRS